MFQTPKYEIKRTWLGELHPTTTEKYMQNYMKGRIEAVAIELHEGRVICHEEHVIQVNT